MLLGTNVRSVWDFRNQILGSMYLCRVSNDRGVHIDDVCMAIGQFMVWGNLEVAVYCFLLGARSLQDNPCPWMDLSCAMNSYWSRDQS